MTPTHFWPAATEWRWLVVGLVVGAILLTVALRAFGPHGIPQVSTSDPYDLKRIEWERDRVITAAKGLASTSVGFLTAVVTALAKPDVTQPVSLLSLLGCLLGAIAMLGLGMHWSLAARRFVLDPRSTADKEGAL